MITAVISDYWRTDITIEEFFQDNFMYLSSLEQYKSNLELRMRCATKSNSEREEYIDMKCANFVIRILSE